MVPSLDVAAFEGRNSIMSMKYTWVYLCLFLSISEFVWGRAPDTLKLVNLVYRHGDRAPVVVFPKDSHNASAWPMGLGWLTPLGMKEHFQLGMWLRDRYDGFLSKQYDHKEIQIQSSNEDRCLMSAYCDLAGLYYPTYGAAFRNITLLPIPVHTKPQKEDNMLNMGKPCPKYDKLMQETLRTHNVTEEEKHNQDFYRFVGQKSGLNHENISNIWRVADTVFCEKTHGLELDPWLGNTSFADFPNETVYEKLRRLESYQFTLLYRGEQAKLKGGPLLGAIVKNVQDKTNSSGKLTTKVFMYSGHDTTVAALLSAMGIFNKVSPPYASLVITELHLKGGKYVVNVFYKNDTNGTNVHQRNLTGCNFDCPLEKFVSLTAPNIPVDWDSECALQSGHPSGGPRISLSTGWVTTIAFGALFLLTLILAVVLFVKYRRSNQGYFYGKLDVNS